MSPHQEDPVCKQKIVIRLHDYQRIENNYKKKENAQATTSSPSECLYLSQYLSHWGINLAHTLLYFSHIGSNWFNLSIKSWTCGHHTYIFVLSTASSSFKLEIYLFRLILISFFANSKLVLCFRSLDLLS